MYKINKVYLHLHSPEHLGNRTGLVLHTVNTTPSE